MFRYLRRPYDNLRRSSLDSQALIKLAHLRLGYMPWTGYALKPAVMLNVVNELIVNDRRSIVEFGAGISTLHLAKVIQQRNGGGSIISIEDDPGWAEVVRDMLLQEKLEDHVQIVVAPLKPCRFSVDGLLWYDEEAVAEVLGENPIDFVLVDGPKACDEGKGLARLPAFRMVSPLLGPRCAIILDDIGRAGEQDVLRLWAAEPDFNFSVKQTLAGCAICWRGAHFITT